MRNDPCHVLADSAASQRVCGASQAVSNDHLSSPKVSGNCVSTVQLCTVSHKQQRALVLLPHHFIFSPMSETKESFTFPWASALWHAPSHPHPLVSRALSLTSKSLFNPRLDYNSEVIAWPSSSSPLSRGHHLIWRSSSSLMYY